MTCRLQEGGSSARLRYYCQRRSRIELLPINTGEEESGHAEASERNACKRYSREGPRGEGLSLCSQATGASSSRGAVFPNKHALKEKGTSGRTEGEEGPRSLVSKSARVQTYRIGVWGGGAEDRKQKPRSERGVTAAAAAMTFAGPAIRIKGRNRMRRSTL